MTTSSAKAREEVRHALRTAAIRLPDLFERGTRLVVGFSGGQDSTCLLHALAHAHRGLDITAVHIDHALRADSADAALRASELAAKIGVACEVKRVDVAAYRESLPGWSIQQAARAARYQALASAVEEHRAAALLVAHTADDQAETLLLNFSRGTGLTGLAGMRLDQTLELRRIGPSLSVVRPGVDRVRLARPLLRVARATTLAYCAQFGLPLVEDASNSSRVYARNRVRLDVLPALEVLNPAIRSVLARAADLAAEDEAALDGIVADLHASLSHDSTYDLRRWRTQPRAVQRRLLRLGLELLVGELVDVGDSAIEDALDLLQTGVSNQAYHLPYGVELCIEAATFVLRLDGRARKRSGRNKWDSQVPRV
jgi:tRNA(Ile)-lysidine synthase